MGKISVVATPIGNLEDITLRAIRILKECEIIFAEDTRHARTLLKHHGITTEVRSYHAHTSLEGLESILELVKGGKHIALITDAGTPGISDPGSELVREARRQIEGVTIEAIPGASAITAALSVAGLITKEWTFLGFLPHKKGRMTLMNRIAAADDMAMIFYESTHRITKALQELEEAFNERAKQFPNSKPKRVIIVREISKMFEEVIDGTVGEVREVLMKDVKKQKGEFVVIVE